jgi:DNA-binding NarL/FixJ family response regulator
MERAAALEDPDRMALTGLSPGAVAANLFLFAGAHDEARKRLQQIRTRLVENGDEGDLAHLLLWLSWLETRCANFDAAEAIANEAITCAYWTGNLSMQRWATAQHAYVHAHTGRIEEALRDMAAASASDEAGVAQIGLWIIATRTFAEVSMENYDAAWEAARPLAEMVEQGGLAEPVPMLFLPDAIESLVALDALDRAGRLLEAFEGRGRELDRSWAIATGARCRALLEMARGDLPRALDAVERGLTEYDRLDMPFDRARTLLVKGLVERRMRRRAHARRSLREAATEFERMGARLWAVRAKNELERVGGRQPREAGELTDAEQRVALLAAEGLSNKEIAAKLFVTVHTVEVHLSHVYAKLGVGSRAKLARALSGTS